MVTAPKYFAIRRSILADRTDLEHVAVIAGLERNPQLTAAKTLITGQWASVTGLGPLKTPPPAP